MTSSFTSDSIKELTLIGLVCDNQDYVRRHILYFSSVSVSFIIADGSTDPMFPDAFDHRLFGLCSVSYFHIPGANSYSERIHRAAALVRTAYAGFIDVGDMYFISGFERALASLKADPLLTFATGRVSICSFAGFDNGYVFTDWGHWSKPFALQQDDPCLRINLLISNMRTGNMYYGVLPLIMFLKLIKLQPRELFFTSSCAAELLWAGILAINNCFEIGNYPFWVRGFSPSVPQKSYSKLDAPEWHFSWPADKIYIVNCLVIELVAVGKISIMAASGAVLQFLTTHYRQSSAEVPKSYLPKIKSLAKKLLSIWPIKVISSRFYSLSAVIRAHDNTAYPDTLLAYWQAIFPDLTHSQISDIRCYDDLLFKYPKGISKEQFKVLFVIS